ncbi:hypothetical protein HMPREF1574_01320 [Gardnerella pickettii JCP7659]|nr:hypothetical protein HMPREF1574_01320 [Gardnerella pickettii JCP7659]
MQRRSNASALSGSALRIAFVRYTQAQRQVVAHILRRGVV